MFSKHTKKRGFTLIELIISIFIFVILAGLFVANFNKGARNDELRRSASEISTIVRKAQNLALIGSQQNLPEGIVVNTGRFGVHFDKTTRAYQLFLDWVDGGDGLFQEEERLPGAVYYLPEGIIINSLAPAGDVLDITFRPPKPAIYFNGLTDDLEAVIELKQANAENYRSIIVNRVSGQVSVEN